MKPVVTPFTVVEN